MLLLRHLSGSSFNSWVRTLIIFCFGWAFLVYVFAVKLSSPPSPDTDAGSSGRRLQQAMALLEATKQRNEEIKQLIEDWLNNQSDKEVVQGLLQVLQHNINNPLSLNEIRDADGGGGGGGGSSRVATQRNEPSLEYELMRRRIQNNIGEMWNYFSHELGQLRGKVLHTMPDMGEEINQILLLGAEHKRSLLSDMEQLHQLDGYEAWRHKEAADLSNLVQRRLHHIQHPANCDSARKLICKLNKGCGYGCQLHHVVYCFIVAYATERTLILKSKGWRYHKSGWEEVFHPISDSCTEADLSYANNWPGRSDSQTLVLPIIDSLMPRPPYLPLAIPEDLAPRLKRLHGDPIVWWVGQFLKYLLKPQKETRELLETGMTRLGWRKPIVGVHIRRTDKVGTEAAFHNLAEYMTYVEDYYLTLETNGTKFTRRIFLASDDARVINEARQKYPQYEVIGDAEVARMAGVSTRYSDSALNGIILDIHLLSLSDYLVCTFSSQVCRVAYEIMQTLYPDAAQRFKSLDDIYYYGGQNAHNRLAVMPHKARNHNEMDMKAGDLIGVAGNHWNGFSKGKHMRTYQVGLFPSFKTIDKVEEVKLPTYTKI